VGEDLSLIAMKEITLKIGKVAMVSSRGRVATSTKVSTKMTSGTATVRCTGRMAAVTKVTGSRASSTGTAG
jgi:hypothetical protein